MKNTKNFASRWGFILASVGSAVGMANVWGFPNKLGSNGGGSFRDGVMFSGDKAYYLFGGRDVTGRIVRITMTQNGETCTMENAEGKTHFLFCTELSPQLGDYDFDRSTLRFYDKDGNDITAEYNLSGGRIA